MVVTRGGGLNYQCRPGIYVPLWVIDEIQKNVAAVISKNKE